MVDATRSKKCPVCLGFYDGASWLWLKKLVCRDCYNRKTSQRERTKQANLAKIRAKRQRESEEELKNFNAWQ